MKNSAILHFHAGVAGKSVSSSSAQNKHETFALVEIRIAEFTSERSFVPFWALLFFELFQKLGESINWNERVHAAENCGEILHSSESIMFEWKQIWQVFQLKLRVSQIEFEI